MVHCHWFTMNEMNEKSLEYLRCWLSICHQGEEVDILELEMIGDNAPLVGNVSAEKRDWATGLMCVCCSAANRLIGEVVQSRRRPLLGPSPD